MVDLSFEQRRQFERLGAEQLANHQLKKLNDLLAAILPCNRFYREKLSSVNIPLTGLDRLSELPFTYKEELSRSRSDGEFTTNLTYPLERYVRFHRTSGTRGKPLAVLDTAEDWQWWKSTWQYVLDVANVEPEDRVAMAFSFGPFIGFWSAYDAAIERGCLVLPGGGMSSLERLEMLKDGEATALFCTPSYALHLADVAAENQRDVASLDIRVIVVAGEPGGSLPAIRSRIERSWNARVVDHSGATEVGPWGYSDRKGRGLHVNEAEFIAEFLSIETGQPAAEGELAELVLTPLGRIGCPVLRFRTGDLVQPSWTAKGDCRFVLLDRGVLGRVDDMMIVRGVNIYPSSIEQILHGFPEVIEYRMTVYKDGEMDALTIEIEDRLQAPDRVAKELRLRLGLNIDVRSVSAGSLPRFEAKGKRFIDQR